MTRALAAATLVALHRDRGTGATIQTAHRKSHCHRHQEPRGHRRLRPVARGAHPRRRKAGALAAGHLPHRAGLEPAFVSFIAQHLKDIAAQVGAPVNDSTSCEHNIAIIFTSVPQNGRQYQKETALHAGLLRQSGTARQTRHRHPSHSGLGQDRDRGRVWPSNDGYGQDRGPGHGPTVPCADLYPGMAASGLCSFQFTEAHAASVTGTRLTDGMRGALYNVVIVADPAKLGDYEMGALADYIAMLALAEITLPEAASNCPVC